MSEVDQEQQIHQCWFDLLEETLSRLNAKRDYNRAFEVALWLGGYEENGHKFHLRKLDGPGYKYLVEYIVSSGAIETLKEEGKEKLEADPSQSVKQLLLSRIERYDKLPFDFEIEPVRDPEDNRWCTMLRDEAEATEAYAQRVQNDINDEFGLSKDDITITVEGDNIIANVSARHVPDSAFKLYLPWLETRYSGLKVTYG